MSAFGTEGADDAPGWGHAHLGPRPRPAAGQPRALRDLHRRHDRCPASGSTTPSSSSTAAAAVSLLGYLTHRRLRRGHLRELGERVPADGHVRRAHRLPVPAWVVGVQADRRAGAAGRGSRGTPATSRMCPGRSAAAAGCSVLYEQLAVDLVLRCCSSAPGCCTLLGGAKAYSEEELAHGGAAGDRAGVSRARRSSGSSRSRTGRASSWPWRPSWALGLPAAAGFGGVQAGRRAARQDRRLSPGRLTDRWAGVCQP